VAACLVGRAGYGLEFFAGGVERFALIFKRAISEKELMDILYLLIPLSVILVFFIIAALWWAIYRGQFEDIESEGERILKDS
jgi:cbb3-type cytochrome oxidase maturation protein